MVLSRFTFSSPSTVPLIQQCNKFSCIIYFTFISHSTVPHIQKCNKFNILILFTLYLIQYFHIFNSLTNSVLLSNFTFSSHSTVPHIQQCQKFNCFISFYILITFNSRTYSTVSQIQLYYLILQSHLIQQSHTFNSVTNSVVLSTFTIISQSTVQTIFNNVANSIF